MGPSGARVLTSPLSWLHSMFNMFCYLDTRQTSSKPSFPLIYCADSANGNEKIDTLSQPGRKEAMSCELFCLVGVCVVLDGVSA